MIDVEVKSSAGKALVIAEREFAQLPGRMLFLANEGAQWLKDGDPYTDRTGNLRVSTQALLTDGSFGGGDVVVVLEMDEHYASYVKKAGWSNFDDAVATVSQEIDAGIRAMGLRITRA